MSENKNIKIEFDNGQTLQIRKELYDDIMELKKLGTSNICELFNITEEQILDAFTLKRTKLSNEILEYLRAKPKFKETGERVDFSIIDVVSDYFSFPCKINSIKYLLKNRKLKISIMENALIRLKKTTYIYNKN